MSPGIEAVSKLSRLGFAFEVNGDRVRYRYQGPDTPDPAQVRPLLKVVKAYKADVLAHLSKPTPPATCEPCPWYELNPWTRDPALGAWCHRQMVHLVVGSPACEEFRRGKVPLGHPYKQVPAVPTATERILTCFDCPRHEHDPINPPEGWGRCRLKKRGCYGLRPACSEILRDARDG